MVNARTFFGHLTWKCQQGRRSKVDLAKEALSLYSIKITKKKFVCSKHFTMASSEKDVSRIKNGASLLSSGGTLTSEPCQKCSGVQVRLGEKITCINCGNEVNTAAGTQQKSVEYKAVPAQRSAVLTSVASLIEEKIALLASEIRVENDISMQRQKAELVERYLGILERTKNLIG
jgi:uncharacterized Zn finger protein (UPF0148 family)